MSKLKTVWDAVNELRGDLSNADCGFRKGNVNLWLNIVENNYISLIGNPFASPEIYELTCTTAEFNALVEEMTLGLDVNGVTHGELFDYVNADKMLLEKETEPDYTSLEFWKDAPEGYDYAVIRNEATDNVSFYKDAPTYQCIFKYGNHHYMLCFKKGDVKYNAKYYHVVKRPQSTPTETPEEKEALDSIINKPLVYTQEMADNGVFESGQKVFIAQMNTLAGVESKRYYTEQYWCNSGHQRQYAELGIIFSNKESAVAKCKSLLGVDTRTKKEKAIDELRNLDDSICNDIEWHANFLQAIIDGKITGVKWVGE